MLEPVSKDGRRYELPPSLARQFALQMNVAAGQNFPRAIDPSHTDHEFADGWQGLHNVRFLCKVDTEGAVVGRQLI